MDTTQILALVQNVRPLSSEASRLLSLMSDEAHTVQDIVRVVECDPALTAQVLKVVNSAAFALNRQVATLETAISFLGDTNVIGIALSAATGDVFNADLAGYDGTRGDLGRHSLWTAIGARELAMQTGGLVNPGVAYTAGLLHDIGKAVISDLLEDGVYEMIQGIEQNEFQDFLAAEKAAVGTDHSAVGTMLAELWKLPAELTEAIARHHDPASADYASRPLVYVVHMADILSMMNGYGTGADAMQYGLDARYEDIVEVKPEKLESTVLNTQIEYNRTASLMFDDAKVEA